MESDNGSLYNDGEGKGPSYLKGRGAQINTRNKFLKNERVREHIKGID